LIYRRANWDDKGNANKKMTSDLERNRRRVMNWEEIEIEKNLRR
jgi:hypothetical protein